KLRAPGDALWPRRLERRQAMCGARTVAALAAVAIRPRSLELAARRRPRIIDRAADGASDVAVECHAAGRRTARSAHRDTMRRDPDGQLRRRRAAEETLALAPMERHAVMCAARAARQARVRHAQEAVPERLQPPEFFAEAGMIAIARHGNSCQARFSDDTRAWPDFS